MRFVSGSVPADVLADPKHSLRSRGQLSSCMADTLRRSVRRLTSTEKSLFLETPTTTSNRPTLMKHLIWILCILLTLAGCGTTSSSGGGSSGPSGPGAGSSGGGASGGGASGGGSAGGPSAGGGGFPGGPSGGGGFPGNSGGGIPGGGSSPGSASGSAGGDTAGGPTAGADEGGIDVDVGGVNVPVPGRFPGEPGTPGLPGSGDSPSGSSDGSGGGLGTASSGEDMPVWEPAPSFDDEGSDTGGLGTSGGSDVRLEDIEKTLDEAMGTFDKEILREQENVRNKTGNNGSGTASNPKVLAGVGTFETYSGSGGTGGGGGVAPGPASSASGSAQTAGAGATFDDNPPPAPDDDIVARQIREAAENEPDPEQRAILWEEYKRYKGGL